MTISRTLLAVGLLLAQPGAAADLPANQPPQPIASSPNWTFRLTPYAWLTSLNGSQTVRGRTTNVDASFADILQTTFDNGGTLAALMLDGEARYGSFALFGDVIWEKISISPGGLRSRSVAPGITGTLGTSLNADYTMGIVEFGGAYEFARVGNVAFDVMAGARYWNQSINVAFDVGATLDIVDLNLTRNRAVARSRSVDWLDGFAGARARIAIAPGQELYVMGNVGAGGSKFTWEAIAAYSYDFTTRNGITYSGILGYKALYADYAQGTGRTRFEYDMLQHGPVVGLSIRF
jgi:hypothetical protein